MLKDSELPQIPNQIAYKENQSHLINIPPASNYSNHPFSNQIYSTLHKTPNYYSFNQSQTRKPSSPYIPLANSTRYVGKTSPPGINIISKPPTINVIHPMHQLNNIPAITHVSSQVRVLQNYPSIIKLGNNSERIRVRSEERGNQNKSASNINKQTESNPQSAGLYLSMREQLECSIKILKEQMNEFMKKNNDEVS